MFLATVHIVLSSYLTYTITINLIMLPGKSYQTPQDYTPARRDYEQFTRQRHLDPV